MNTTLSADDRWSIYDLYARYCWELDFGDAESWAATFTQNGFHGGNSGVRVRGREALIEYADRVGPLIKQKALQHWNANILVTAAGEGRAVGRCYMMAAIAVHAPVYDQPGVVIERIGRYSDRLVRVDGQWQFEEKIFDNYYVGAPSEGDFRPWDAVVAGAPDRGTYGGQA
jgi:hypothetical protein